MISKACGCVSPEKKLAWEIQMYNFFSYFNVYTNFIRKNKFFKTSDYGFKAENCVHSSHTVNVTEVTHAEFSQKYEFWETRTQINT